MAIAYQYSMNISVNTTQSLYLHTEFTQTHLRLQLVSAVICTHDIITTMVILHNYHAVLPEPPNVIINKEILCILPYGENDNPPDSYNILVYDITGERILQDNITAAINLSTCIPIMHQHPSECTPLLVLVSAINMFGQVNTATYINYQNETGDACSCLKETGI